MSAKKPPHFAGLGRRKKLILACLAIVCALVAVGLYAWQSQPVPEAALRLRRPRAKRVRKSKMSSTPSSATT